MSSKHTSYSGKYERVNGNEKMSTITTSSDGSMQKIPSDSCLPTTSSASKDEAGRGLASYKSPWERSQSALDLQNKDGRSVRTYQSSEENFSEQQSSCSTGTVSTASGGGAVSEHSKVYWDLSDATENEADANAANRAAAGGGKFKISLQTIHQKEEMSAPGNKNASTPGLSIQAHVIRRMSTESSHITSRQQGDGASIVKATITSPPIVTGSAASSKFTLSYSKNGEPQSNLVMSLEKGIPAMRKEIASLMSASRTGEKCRALGSMLHSIEGAWASPVIGRDLAYKLCDVLRDDGALQMLIENCESPQQRPDNIKDDDDLQIEDDEESEELDDSPKTPSELTAEATPTSEQAAEDSTTEADTQNDSMAKMRRRYALQLNSARVLEQSLTTNNRDYVVSDAQRLKTIVRLASAWRDDKKVSACTTGILDNLFKHSPQACTSVIGYGGLDAVLYSCRTTDAHTLRNCAEALANLALYGGAHNQCEMVSHHAAEWLFPLAFSDDVSTRYYALLAIAALSANKELLSAVRRSGTLELVNRFVREHDPEEFSKKHDKAHLQGHAVDWLKKLVPLLDAYREETKSIVAFHFAMEAYIKVNQNNIVVFTEIGAIEPLKRVACSTNRVAAKLAARALELVGESVPYELSPQVPLWGIIDVQRWLTQIGFEEYCAAFKENQVDGDLLLQLDDFDLEKELHMTNGITRKRFKRELTKLKLQADYSSCDPSQLCDWLENVNGDLLEHSYGMLRAGADIGSLKHITDTHLRDDCQIRNGIHVSRMLYAAKHTSCVPRGLSCESGDRLMDRPIDCFISYRRSNGSQLASLLKVHLQLRGFSVFLDIEKLRAGKFDDNLLLSIRNAKHFILVLTQNALDRCQNDTDKKDWVHREIVAAMEGGCNVIPVMDNFCWPPVEHLPEDMRAVCYFNGISWVHDYQDACMKKLEDFLNGVDS